MLENQESSQDNSSDGTVMLSSKFNRDKPKKGEKKKENEPDAEVLREQKKMEVQDVSILYGNLPQDTRYMNLTSIASF